MPRLWTIGLLTYAAFAYLAAEMDWDFRQSTE